ncbi:hypothetical protein [Legionella maioricensis]|uniref:Uncharacterized protein n=1 Tax=Legionella maioricensis TaxID=2896528 RepID=A0A9X2D2Z0_9GAMM|nr:hypothetical protein [Legionella maioricensis]MCL9685599.1 hypothetical protein [Legionella maioricensis]MCL9689008.1 hypothetical protein [Legionella maioricensis]
MHQGPSEIVVLKPTTVFLSFLASQLPENDLPSLKLLQTDCTAYVINKHHAVVETIEEIEKNFSAMFRHEICRWLGNNARNEIETSFLDFLCCFKFEMHSHLVLMEPSIEAGNQLLIIKPRSSLLKWMKSAIEGQEELENVMERVTLSHLAENATVIIKNFSDLKEIKSFMAQYYKPIFETAMSRMSNQSSEWPVVNSFQSFSQYFTVEIHTQLIHLPS